MNSHAAGRRGLAPDLERRVGRVIGALARFLAMLGGLVLVGVTVMSVLSIAGRALIRLGLGPVPGDFELVQIGVAFAVFAFLPWCQYRRGHVTVDLAVHRFGPRGRAAFAFAANVLMTVAAGLIAWRLYAGLIDKTRYGETSFILQIPVWWGYAAGLVGAALFALVALYTVWRSLNEALGPGESQAAGPGGSEIGE